MKRIAIIAVVLAGLALGGCSGITANAEYRGLIVSTAQLSAETAYRANCGQLTPDEMKQALTSQSIVWARFVDALNGVDSRATTQPAK